MFGPQHNSNNGRTLSGNYIVGEPTLSSVFSNAFSDSAHFLRPIDAVDNVPQNNVRSTGHLSMGFGSLSACENQNSVFAEPDRSFSGEAPFNMTPTRRFDFYCPPHDFGSLAGDQADHDRQVATSPPQELDQVHCNLGFLEDEGEDRFFKGG